MSLLLAALAGLGAAGDRLDRLFHGHVVGLDAARQRRIGGAMLEVGAIATVDHVDQLAILRMLADLAQDGELGALARTLAAGIGGGDPLDRVIDAELPRPRSEERRVGNEWVSTGRAR